MAPNSTELSEVRRGCDMPWLRVKRTDPCPVCNKTDWCLVAEDGSATICPRVSEGSVKYFEKSGFLHILRESDNSRRYPRTITIKEPDAPALDFEQLAEGYEDAITPVIRRELADRLGVSTESLRRLSVGWDGDSWTLPMFDGNGQMIGIQRRFPSGSKCCVGRSHLGLFLPEDLDRTRPLFICEGASDTAAAITLGLEALGRPNRLPWTQLVAKAARGYEEIIVVSDNDPDGRKDASDLAESLALYFSSVKVIFPPDGVKDLRGWLRSGLTHNHLLDEVKLAEPVSLGVRCV